MLPFHVEGFGVQGSWVSVLGLRGLWLRLRGVRPGLRVSGYIALSCKYLGSGISG